MDRNGHGPRSVLVVDDEPTIAEIVCRYLARAGYRASLAADGFEALAAIARSRPDLVVLDLMLPGVGGLEVLRRIREEHEPGLAVILLTAKGEEADRISGLRLGADDYVVKPFSPRELVARVDAVLRRLAPTPEELPILELDGLRIDPASRRVWVRGEEVQLTLREFDLLLYLARHPSQVFSRHHLMGAVWDWSFHDDTSTVTVHVRRLRAKIELDAGRPRFLQTVWGVGYRFEA